MARLTLALLLAVGTSVVQAQSFLDRLKDAVEETAKQTAEQVVIQTASDLVREMIITYTLEQTSSEAEVSEVYEEENGELPVNTTVTAYRTEILPAAAVSPGTEVHVKTFIEVVPGSNGKKAVIEEKLIIWDNEDNTVALKSMRKRAGSKGGAFAGEFTFSLPEGMPQGVYPITTSLMMDGEWLQDEKHRLQLVFYGESDGDGTLVAAGNNPERERTP